MRRPYFDLFLIYQPTEQGQATEIAARLEQRGWQICLSQREDDLARSLGCAMLIGPASLTEPAPIILQAALDRATLDRSYGLYARDHSFRVWPVLLPDLDDPFDPDLLPPGLANYPWLDLRSTGFEAACLDTLCDPIRAKAVIEPPDSSPDSARVSFPLPGPYFPLPDPAERCPYPGLAGFDNDQADLFFGRPAAVQRLVEKLKASRFLALVGPAGVGKSSIVQAGLVPALRRLYPDLSVQTLRPAQQLLTASLEPPVEQSEEIEPIPALALSAATTSRPTGSPFLPPRAAEPQRQLLIVEQFEEVFTLLDETARDEFLTDVFEQASDRTTDTYLILTMRTEYLTACATYPALASRLSSQFVVNPLDEEGWQTIIEEPARRVGLSIEPGLVGCLLDDMAELKTSPDRVQNLALLQYTLRNLWESVPHQPGLTIAAYREQGGLATSISRQAEAIFNSLDRPGQVLLRRIMLHLAWPSSFEGSPTRFVVRPARLSELSNQPRETPQIEAILDRLVAARLVNASDESPDEPDPLPSEPSEQADLRRPLLPAALTEPISAYFKPDDPNRKSQIASTRRGVNRKSYCLAGEVVVEAWPRLRQWVEARSGAAQVSRQLRLAVREWEQHARPDHLLYSGVRLAQAVESLELGDPNLGGAEREFVRLSRHRAQRPIRLTVIGLAIGLSLLLVVTLVTFFQNRAADQQRDQARQEANTAATALARANEQRDQADKARLNATNFVQVARSRELAAQSIAQLASDPQLSLLLAIEATQANPTDEARNALQLALTVPQPLAVYPITNNNNPIPVIVSPDGRWLAVKTASETNDRIELKSLALNNDANSRGASFGIADPTRKVSQIAFSPNSQLLGVLDNLGGVHLWNVNSRNQLLNENGNPTSLPGAYPGDRLAFSADNNWLLVGDRSGKVRVWQFLGNNVSPIFKTETPTPVNNPIFVPQSQSFLTSFDKTFTVWSLDPPPGKSLVETARTYSTTDSPITILTLTPDGKSVLTAHANGKVIVWEYGTGKLRNTLDNANFGTIVKMVVSPDGWKVTLINQEGQAGVWDLASTITNGVKLQTNPACFSYSPDGRRFIICNNPSEVKLYDSRSFNLLMTLSGTGDDPIYSANFSPDGKYIVATSSGQTQVWNVGNEVVLPHEKVVNTLAFSPDSNLVVTGSEDKTVKVWNTGGREVKSFSSPSDTVLAVALSPDGKMVAAAGKDHLGRIWPTVGGNGPISQLVGHTAPINSIAFSPDGQQAVTASDDKTARVWRVGDGSQIAVINHSGNVNRAVFSPDGQTVATASEDNTAIIWQDGKTQVILNGHSKGVKWVTFSPDGKLVATASDDSTARVWDLTGKQIISYTIPAGGSVNMVTFSSDSTRLLVAGSSQGAYMVEATTGKVLLHFSVASPVRTANFSPDGTMVLTASDDGLVRLWDAANGQFLTVVASRTGSVTTAAFSPDGKFVAAAGSGDASASLSLCQICGPTDGLLDRARVRAKVGRPLTPQERQKYLHENP